MVQGSWCVRVSWLMRSCGGGDGGRQEFDGPSEGASGIGIASAVAVSLSLALALDGEHRLS